MFPIVDSCNPPDERSTIVCATFLCARLLESSRERLAATVIQRMFRRFQNRLQTRSLSRVVSRIELFWLYHKDQYYANMRALYLPSVRKLELFFIRYRHKIEMLKKDRLSREKVLVCRQTCCFIYCKEIIFSDMLRLYFSFSMILPPMLHVWFKAFGEGYLANKVITVKE